jgi:hypothetical protein
MVKSAKVSSVLPLYRGDLLRTSFSHFGRIAKMDNGLIQCVFDYLYYYEMRYIVRMVSQNNLKFE